MHDSFVPLIASAGAFLAVLLWRVRPVVLWRKRQRASREALQQAQVRVEEARDSLQRARALCDAADLAAMHLRTVGSAASLYLRAMRADPASTEIVTRAVAALARRPHALESLLWRRLAFAPWEDSRPATRATLDALRALYEGRLRNAVRARALAHALELVREEPQGPVSPASPVQ